MGGKGSGRKFSYSSGPLLRAYVKTGNLEEAGKLVGMDKESIRQKLERRGHSVKEVKRKFQAKLEKRLDILYDKHAGEIQNPQQFVQLCRRKSRLNIPISRAKAVLRRHSFKAKPEAGELIELILACGVEQTAAHYGIKGKALLEYLERVSKKIKAVQKKIS